MILFPIVSLETWVVRPELYRAMAERPLAWMSLATILTGVWALWTGLRGRGEGRAFVGSCAIVAGLLAGLAASIFPIMLLSTIGAEHSMTAYGGATAGRGLIVALVWWPLALALAITYLAVIMSSYRGKVRPAEDTQGFY